MCGFSVRFLARVAHIGPESTFVLVFVSTRAA